MRKKRHSILELLTEAGLTLTLAAGTLLPVVGHAWPADGSGDKAASGNDLAAINVAFKLDPRITKGTYMGERWISPPTYSSTHDGKTGTLQARAAGADAKGAPVGIRAQWIPVDPEMVTVSPSEGSEVKITVHRAGETKLHVTSQGLSRELAVKAAYRGNAIKVEISQVQPNLPAAADAAPLVTTAFKSDKQKLSYALGMSLGSEFRKQSLEVDKDLYVKGLEDGFSGGTTLMTEDEVRAAVLTLQKEIKDKQLASHVRMRKEIAEKSRTAAEAFLAGNRNKDGVITLESGLQYKILKAGDGQKPTIDDQVVCHYRGMFIDGTEFDSSYKRSKPSTLSVRHVLQGWTEALQLMPVGSKWQIFIPPNLAYGETGTGKIGPNATLVFDIELISVGPALEAARSAAK